MNDSLTFLFYMVFEPVRNLDMRILIVPVFFLAVTSLASVINQPVYLAASGHNSNDGLTPATAWLDVTALNGKTFGPGAQILFKCGDTFSGNCTLTGSGEATSPILIRSYGTGTKPHLTGSSDAGSIFLLNSGNQYIEFRDLKMSNFNTSNPAVIERQVIQVRPPAGSEEMSHLHFINLEISNVQGYPVPSVPEDDHRSYAIWLETEEDHVNRSRFNDVLCENCTFANIDGRAFSLNDRSQTLADHRLRGTPYFPSIHCVFQNNYATNVYRNMAMVLGVKGFLMQYNTMDTTVKGSAFWPFNSEDTLVQFNVFKRLRASDGDGYACHFDYNCKGTVMQYNFGYDVEGGLIQYLVNSTQADRFQEDGVARYNIGIDVGWRNKINGAGIFLNGQVTGGQFYNNTIIQQSKPLNFGISFNDWGGAWPATNRIHNNIFYAAGPATVTYGNANQFSNRGNRIRRNLYYGSIVPPSADSLPITGNPKFANPDGITPADFKVLFGSAAIAQGKAMAENGGRDYFGYGVDATLSPAIGFHEYSSDPVIDSDGDAMLDLWENTYGLNPGNAVDATADPDGDGDANIMEFAVGGNPTNAAPSGHRPVVKEESGKIIYVYPRRINSALTYSSETSDNLKFGEWTDADITVTGTSRIDELFESVTNEVPHSGPQGFFRLRVQ